MDSSVQTLIGDSTDSTKVPDGLWFVLDGVKYEPAEDGSVVETGSSGP
ncbi:MAG: hypothetical protein K6F53_10015 [Lachnospiraceae bacterium]|nr:hypothetical protein [Lachnospiraceae bacterium]